jgi:hypothetical protein
MEAKFEPENLMARHYLVKFKYLGMAITNQNLIHEEIKSRLSTDNACYHSVWNLLSFSLLSRNIMIKIYKTIILPVSLLWVRNFVSDIMGEI